MKKAASGVCRLAAWDISVWFYCIGLSGIDRPDFFGDFDVWFVGVRGNSRGEGA
jgi:hypothetical protein